MQKIIIALVTIILSSNIRAGEPQSSVTNKPKTILAPGDKVNGKARLVGTNNKVTIYTCDKATTVCLYIAKKKAFEDDPGLAPPCKVTEPWVIPPALEAMYDQNYPYAIAFDAPILTFIPVNDVAIECPQNEQGNIQILITSDATLPTP